MSEREKQELNEPKNEDYRYRWNYGDQCAWENQNQKKIKSRGAWIYALVMVSVFASCLALLVGVLVWYHEDEPTDQMPPASENNALWTVAEVSERVTPSTVLIYASASSTSGYGTGFFIRSDGYIATNYHVVQNKRNIQVTLYSGESVDAKLIAYSQPDDLAVLKIAGTNYPTVTIGDSDALRVGELAIAIGNPSGKDASWTTTHGIISALERGVTVTGNGTIEEMAMIQTDAPVNPGNSGGPLCNAKGEVIGIVTRKLSDYEGIGFAIPINGAMKILNTIVETGSADGIESTLTKVRPTIGIKVYDIEKGETYQDSRGNEYTAEKSGVMISSVERNGSAYGILQAGDIIIGMNDQTVQNQNDLLEILYRHEVGDEVSITVWRLGEAATFKLRLGKS